MFAATEKPVLRIRILKIADPNPAHWKMRNLVFITNIFFYNSLTGIFNFQIVEND